MNLIEQDKVLYKDKQADAYKDFYLEGLAYNKLEFPLWKRVFEKNFQNKKGFVTLDLAAGTGKYTELINQYSEARAIGIDISQKMIEKANHQKAANTNLSFHVADCLNSEEIDNIVGSQSKFDLINANWLLAYVNNREKLEKHARYIYNKLNDGGKYIAVNMNPYLDYTS